MLETKNLCKIYKPKKGVPVTALDKISLRFPDKGMIFLLGKSGSGKSTLLNLLGGLDRYDNGEIIIKGVSSKDFKQKHFDSYRNTYVGFIFQEYNVLEEFSVGANIALAIELQNRKASDCAGTGEKTGNYYGGRTYRSAGFQYWTAGSGNAEKVVQEKAGHYCIPRQRVCRKLCGPYHRIGGRPGNQRYGGGHLFSC